MNDLTQSITIYHLPNEIMMNIFSYVDPIDLILLCRKVCRAWNESIKDDFLWKNLPFSRSGCDLFFNKDKCSYMDLFKYRYVKKVDVIKKFARSQLFCKVISTPMGSLTGLALKDEKLEYNTLNNLFTVNLNSGQFEERLTPLTNSHTGNLLQWEKFSKEISGSDLFALTESQQAYQIFSPQRSYRSTTQQAFIVIDSNGEFDFYTGDDVLKKKSNKGIFPFGKIVPEFICYNGTELLLSNEFCEYKIWKVEENALIETKYREQTFAGEKIHCMDFDGENIALYFTRSRGVTFSIKNDKVINRWRISYAFPPKAIIIEEFCYFVVQSLSCLEMIERPASGKYKSNKSDKLHDLKTGGLLSLSEGPSSRSLNLEVTERPSSHKRKLNQSLEGTRDVENEIRVELFTGDLNSESTPSALCYDGKRIVVASVPAGKVYIWDFSEVLYPSSNSR